MSDAPIIAPPSLHGGRVRRWVIDAATATEPFIAEGSLFEYGPRKTLVTYRSGTRYPFERTYETRAECIRAEIEHAEAARQRLCAELSALNTRLPVLRAMQAAETADER